MCIYAFRHICTNFPRVKNVELVSSNVFRPLRKFVEMLWINLLTMFFSLLGKNFANRKLEYIVAVAHKGLPVKIKPNKVSSGSNSTLLPNKFVGYYNNNISCACYGCAAQLHEGLLLCITNGRHCVYSTSPRDIIGLSTTAYHTHWCFGYDDDIDNYQYKIRSRLYSYTLKTHGGAHRAK